MLTVYRVRVNIEKYQFFESDDLDFSESLYPKLHRAEIGNVWKAPSVYILYPKQKEGHFVGFLGGGIFAVAQNTMDEFVKLRTFFEQSGEQFPIMHKGRLFVVYNCTNRVNALDEKKSEYVRGPGSMITEHVFLPMRLQFPLFCIPQNRELFCVEGLSAPQDEFKRYVEENKLTGLMFEKLWSDEGPKKQPKKVRKKK